MDLRRNADGRGGFARTLLAVGLAVAAIRSLQKGKRVSAALAGAGALALGYNATAGGAQLEETLDIDATGEEAELRCAICGHPIRLEERRGPNEDGEIVHDACKASAE